MSLDTFTHTQQHNPADSRIQSSASIDLLALIGDTIDGWKVHRCQITDALMSQHEPIKFIYHYEHLSDLVKLQHPLNGNLLAAFDQVLTREQFAQMLGIHLNQVAKPWQLKFLGKLVIFYQNPEIALRLQWVNTIKAFEPVYQSTKGADADILASAIDNAFTHWQITGVEIIQKNPQIALTYQTDAATMHTILSSTQFVTAPNSLANILIDYLQTHPIVADEWLTMIKAEAHTFAQNNRLIAVR